MGRSGIVWILALLLGLTLGMNGFAVDKEVKQEVKPTPALAAFGIYPTPHSCTVSYKGCTNTCQKTGGANCELECLSDCNVCALDFGEEALDVCRR